ncbi:polysaccharide deacetylase family protein [Vibrio sp. JC009]|uniref:polysaccharide deacetylase family protein n=1 Tax=Vibrio sp. JC009 TaxID=2912314 RepID=UPI0023B202B3|nr:polysaccharide deacetylase family protein [Vibrio sp. JC009]WED22961.1 polysaccharide deacetylase family protein [Vibrio sp. JC009]
MKPMERPYNRKVNFFSFSALLTLVMTGCASGPSAPVSGVVSENKDFIFVRKAENENYQMLAQRYYGSSALAEKISRVNPADNNTAGSLIAIPKRVINPSGVYPDGYRTIPILCYHRFTGRETGSDRLDMPVAFFRAQLQYLADNNYYIIPLKELNQYLMGNKEIPEKSVVITMDDGYRSVYKYAYPLLKAFNAAATLFLYTDFIEAPHAVTWKQVAEMQQSGVIDMQSHSKSHASVAVPLDPEIDLTKQTLEEVKYPAALIKRKTGNKPDIFSFPYGDSNDETINILYQQGVKMAVTVQQGGNPSFANPYLLKRTMIYADDNMASFVEKLKVFRREKLQ